MNKLKNKISLELKKKISLEIKRAWDNNEFWVKRYEVAEMAGVSPTTLYNVLNGRGSLESIMMVAGVFNINIDLIK